MWTVTITNIDNGVADVNANFTDAIWDFSFGSRIKTADLQGFSDRAKSEFLKYQELHKNDVQLKSDLETILNK